MSTNFSSKCLILSDLWINYKEDEQFADFIEYNDIGMPLAYFIHTDLVEPKDQGKMYVEETFNLLCEALELDMEEEYNSLNEMFDKAAASQGE